MQGILWRVWATRTAKELLMRVSVSESWAQFYSRSKKFLFDLFGEIQQQEKQRKAIRLEVEQKGKWMEKVKYIHDWG